MLGYTKTDAPSALCNDHERQDETMCVFLTPATGSPGGAGAEHVPGNAAGGSAAPGAAA